jgi:hypothetical protein
MKFAILVCVALTGCSTAGKFDNVLVTTLNGDRAFVASMYGPFGLTAELRAQDARELDLMKRKAAIIDIMSGGQK